MNDTWTELIIAVVSAILGWFARHFTTPKPKE